MPSTGLYCTFALLGARNESLARLQKGKDGGRSTHTPRASRSQGIWSPVMFATGGGTAARGCGEVRRAMSAFQTTVSGTRERC